MRTLSFWHTIHLFRRPGGSVINPASILSYMQVSFRAFKISWNTYCLNYPCKSGLIADTLLIRALHSSWYCWLFLMSMLSLCPNCWSSSWAFQGLVQPFTLRLLKNAPKASWMACAMHGVWFLNAGQSIPEASRIDCHSLVIEWYEEPWSVAVPSKWPSVSSKRSKTSLKCTACLDSVCWPLT